MKLRDNKGSITIFVLVGLLFMSSFLIISFGSNVNKSKSAKEQFNILNSIYSKNDGDENAYMRAYTAIRRRNAQQLTTSVENTNTLNLTKTFEDTISDYKIYGNSVQNGTPSPTSPVEVESVGEKTKNILPFPYKQTGTTTLSGVSFTVNDDQSITVNGTSTGNIYYKLSGNSATNYNEFMDIENGTYSFSGCPSGGSQSTYKVQFNYFSDENGTRIYIDDLGSGNTVTINGTAPRYDVWIVIYKGFTANNLVFKPQVEIGTTVTSYEQYGKYKIPVKVSGKNLFDSSILLEQGFKLQEDGSYWAERANVPYQQILFSNENKYKGQLSISYDLKYILYNDIVGAVMKVIYTDGTSELVSMQKLTEYERIVFNSNPNKVVDYVVWGYGTTNTQTYIKNIQIEYGDTATEYKPYREQTFNIYLDEPLRKVGNYKDYIDFENKILYRIIKQGQINGSSTFGKFANVTNHSAFYMAQNDLIEYETNGSLNVPVLSNKFTYRTCGGANVNSSWTADYQIGGSASTTYKRICFTLPNTVTDVASAKTWLASNPIDYYYPTSDPIEQTIDLPELEMYEDYTNIEVLTETPPSKIEVTYYGYTME